MFLTCLLYIVIFLFLCVSFSKMSFSIAHFIDDNTVEVVPENWISREQDSCYWPPYRGTRLTTAVRSHEEPLLSWTVYSIRIMETYGLC